MQYPQKKPTHILQMLPLPLQMATCLHKPDGQSRVRILTALICGVSANSAKCVLVVDTVAYISATISNFIHTCRHAIHHAIMMDRRVLRAIALSQESRGRESLCAFEK